MSTEFMFGDYTRAEALAALGIADASDPKLAALAAMSWGGNALLLLQVNAAENGWQFVSVPTLSLPSASIQTTEAITAGQLCNVYTASGAVRVRKANATDTTKPANAFATAGASSGANAVLGFVGQIISGLSGLTPGTTYWLDTTGGAITATPPSGAGNGNQEVGVALSATTLLFHPKTMIGL